MKITRIDSLPPQYRFINDGLEYTHSLYVIKTLHRIIEKVASKKESSFTEVLQVIEELWPEDFI